MANKIITYDVWIGNLPLSADEKNVGKVFSRFGETASMFIRTSKTGDYKYGFIKYFSEGDADKAVSEIDGKEVDGKTISVKRDFKQVGKDSDEKEKPRNKRNIQKPLKKPDLDLVQSRPPTESRKERENVLITHCESPITVWIQTVTDENTQKLLDLSDQLAALCPAAAKLSGPVVQGKIYATLFSEDNQWYRCQIRQSLGSDTIKVQYIDYGNTEEVKADHLVEIPQSLASVKPLATKLILHNCYAHDLSDQNGINYLKNVTENIMLEAVKTVQLKDNTGHYGILYGSGVCLNDQVKEHGFAYTRPAMNANKSDDNAAPGMIAINRVTASPLMQNTMGEQIIGSGGGYADSGGGGYGDVAASPGFGFRPNDGGNAFRPNDGGNGFRPNDGGKLQPSRGFQRLESGSPDLNAEIEKLRQELAKKNMQLQQVLVQNSKIEASKDTIKVLQAQVTKKQRELEKTKAELMKKTLILEQVQTNKLELQQVTNMCEQVRHLRCQFPTGQRSILEEAISVVLSDERIDQTVTTLQPLVSTITRYNLIQKEISSCTDKVEVENLISTRNSARQEYYEKAGACIQQLKSLPLDERSQALQEVENLLRQNYGPFLAFNVHNNLSLEELVPGYNDWKVKREAECRNIRSLTSSFENTVEQNILNLSKMMKLDSGGESLTMPWDEMLNRYAQLLQQEILCTDLEQTGDASLIAAVIKAIVKELSNEMKNIKHFKKLIGEFTGYKEGIEPWLTVNPNTEELSQIKKTIRGLKSKLRHKDADRQDLEEACDSGEEELTEVKSEIQSLKSDLHKALLSQEKFLLDLAKATTNHFPELISQFEDLGIKSLLVYDGLVTAGRELEYYTLSNTWKEGMYSSQFAGNPVYLQEYMVGDADHLDKELFIKNVSRYKEVTCNCPQLPQVQCIFFVKNERLGYVQVEHQEVMCLQEIVKAQLDIQLRQKIIENLGKSIQCLHEGHIIHGEINPSNIGYTSDGDIVLLCPDFSKSLEDRLKKAFLAENGLCFRCPEVACGRSAGTKSTDMYCLGLVILWLYFPSINIPFKADGYPRLNDLQMDPQISSLLYNLLCNPDSRYRANQMLDCEYIKAKMAIPASNKSDTSTDDTFSTSTSICSVIENFNVNALPPCEDVQPNQETFSEESFPPAHGTVTMSSVPAGEDSFPEVSQFNPMDFDSNQNNSASDGIYVNNAEMLANCILQLPPLSEMPRLPESDADLSESYQTPEGLVEEAEEKTGGNISPIPDEVDELENSETC
ncbi:serine/threonine-protein kinase 31-like isoform X3 [Mytilus californianus]|uniref:serine/threonine-protein kinase 31-like isoform X3 n=1 Tax=Mytilus californianus TaxID=6549 RepID=UPI002247C833|nr:serine/threonine-protein kinase 31-like isoform X3 [Mytilus californianus]